MGSPSIDPFLPHQPGERAASYRQFGGLRTIWVKSMETCSRSSGRRKVTVSSSTQLVRPPAPEESAPARRLQNQRRMNLLFGKHRRETGDSDGNGSIRLRTLCWPQGGTFWIFLQDMLFCQELLRFHISQAQGIFRHAFFFLLRLRGLLP